MSQDQHFQFVQALARDLNRKDIKLPSFPDVVIRIRRALDDPDCSGEDLAGILSVEPVLASRILILANSSYHNPSGVRIESLNSAVGRVGFEKVRTASITHAVEQLYASDQLATLKVELQQTWAAGLRIAALSEVLARQCTKLDSDAAFIAGLLHRIGSLYIFTKYEDFPELMRDRDMRERLIDEWEAPIGESIVANWGFSPEVQETLNPNDTERRVEPNLADVVVTARNSLDGDKIVFCQSDEARRLALNEDKMDVIEVAYKQKLESLSSAVGG